MELGPGLETNKGVDPRSTLCSVLLASEKNKLLKVHSRQIAFVGSSCSAHKSGGQDLAHGRK
jgi:hypothetical protein